MKIFQKFRRLKVFLNVKINLFLTIPFMKTFTQCTVSNEETNCPTFTKFFAIIHIRESRPSTVINLLKRRQNGQNNRPNNNNIAGAVKGDLEKY